VEFRKQVAKSVGAGFSVPTVVVHKVHKIEVKKEAARALETLAVV
jgi:hypothetical protein